MGTQSAPGVESRPTSASLDGVRFLGPELVVAELQHEAQLVLAEQGVDVAHDSSAAADCDPVPNLERFFPSEVTGRDHLVTKPQLVSVFRHPRYAPSAEPGVEAPNRAAFRSPQSRAPDKPRASCPTLPMFPR